MQFGRHRGNGAACDGIPVCCDLNEVAYGNKVVVIVDAWEQEKYRVINLDSAVLEKMKNSLLLFYYYHRYGLFIIHWRAAIMGCVISEKGSGITYAGKEAFLNALQTFDNKPPQRLNSHSFATQLLKHAQSRCCKMYSSHSVAVELRRVAHWFAVGGTYYDQAANVRSVDGDIVRTYSLYLPTPSYDRRPQPQDDGRVYQRRAHADRGYSATQPASQLVRP